MPETRPILELLACMKGDPDAVAFLLGHFLFGASPAEVHAIHIAWKEHKAFMNNPGNGM